MTVVGSGEQRRDFTFVADVVRANLMAAERPDVTGIINIGTGTNYSIIDLTRMIGGEDALVEYLPARVGETHDTLADNSRARAALGWSPQVALADVIDSY